MNRAINSPELKRKKRGGAAHAHHTAWLGAHFGNDLLRRLCLDQHSDAAFVEFTPDFGHREAARGAIQETYAQALLQQQNAAAQLRLLNTERTPGRAKAAVIDDGRKIIEIVEVLHRPV